MFSLTHHSTKNLIADTGASENYIDSNTPANNKIINNNPLQVKLPNGEVLHSTHTALLHLPGIKEEATQAHIIPNLKNTSLLSIGQLCNNDYLAVFDKSAMKIYDDHNLRKILENYHPVLEGERNGSNGLWEVKIGNQPKSTHLNVLSNLDVKLKERVTLLYRALFSPNKRCLVESIKADLFLTWPTLTVDNVEKYISKMDLHYKRGHMSEIPKNTKSTKELVKPASITQKRVNGTQIFENNSPQNKEHGHLENLFPPIEPSNNTIFATIQKFNTPENKCKIYTDQTGQFPVRSNRGFCYIMIFYLYDINAIIGDPLKNRSEGEMTTVYVKRMDYFKSKGYHPTLHWLDNEKVTGIQDYDRLNNIEYQFTPPNVHRSNSAERAIRTWKDHFLSGISNTHSQFPLYLWDRLVDQANITLNLMRKSRIHPTLSAYQELEGTFNYNKTPIFPPGCKVLIHEKASQRHTWGLRGIIGWYLGPAMHHYRCVRVYVPTSKSERITDNITILTDTTLIPDLSPQENILQETKDLTNEINKFNKKEGNSPYQSTIESLEKLKDLFPLTKDTDKEGSVDKKVEQTYVHHLETHSSKQIPPPHRYPLRSKMNSILNDNNGSQLEYRHLIQNPTTKSIWENSFCNELGRLSQGYGDSIKGTNTMFFIPYSNVPLERRKDVTYGRIVVDYRPHKEETHRTRLTVGGNLI